MVTFVVAGVVTVPLGSVPASFRWTIKEPRLRPALPALVLSQNVLVAVGATTTTATEPTIGRSDHRFYIKQAIHNFAENQSKHYIKQSLFLYSKLFAF